MVKHSGYNVVILWLKIVSKCFMSVQSGMSFVSVENAYKVNVMTSNFCWWRCEN